MARVPNEQQVKYMEEHAGDDKGPVAIVVNVVCLAVASFAVALRFTSRRVLRAGFRADDWSIVFGLVR